MFEFLKGKTNKELENLLTTLKLDESNNYKDAAQDDFRRFCVKFEELSAKGKLNGKQKENYSEVMNFYQEKLKGFTHKDQKPYWYTEKK